MEKFCPEMSNPVAVTITEDPRYTGVEMFYVNCMKEKCPKWISWQGEGGLVEGDCAVKVSAERRV